jgi:hypothetical protein
LRNKRQEKRAYYEEEYTPLNQSSTDIPTIEICNLKVCDTNFQYDDYPDFDPHDFDGFDNGAFSPIKERDQIPQPESSALPAVNSKISFQIDPCFPFVPKGLACYYKDAFRFNPKCVVVHKMGSIMDNYCEDCGAFYSKDELNSNNKYVKCCKSGNVIVPTFKSDSSARSSELKKLLLQLLDYKHVQSKQFMQEIRKINTSLAFASTIVTSEQFASNQRGPPVLMIHGNIAHRLGSLEAPEGRIPQYMQAYFYENEEAPNYFVQSGQMHGNLLPLVNTLRSFLKGENQFYTTLKTALEVYKEQDQQVSYKTVIKPPNSNTNSSHPGQLNTPECCEVALLAGFDSSNVFVNTNKTTVIYRKHGGLKEISYKSSHYMPLSYPLIHLFGELGWHYDLISSGKHKKKLL